MPSLCRIFKDRLLEETVRREEEIYDRASPICLVRVLVELAVSLFRTSGYEETLKKKGFELRVALKKNHKEESYNLGE